MKQRPITTVIAIALLAASCGASESSTATDDLPELTAVTVSTPDLDDGGTSTSSTTVSPSNPSTSETITTELTSEEAFDLFEQREIARLQYLHDTFNDVDSTHGQARELHALLDTTLLDLPLEETAAFTHFCRANQAVAFGQTDTAVALGQTDTINFEFENEYLGHHEINESTLVLEVRQTSLETGSFSITTVVVTSEGVGPVVSYDGVAPIISFDGEEPCSVAWSEEAEELIDQALTIIGSDDQS